MTLGAQIRQLRKAQGLLQRELAQKAGLNVETVGRLERYPDRSFTLESLQAVARALGGRLRCEIEPLNVDNRSDHFA